MKNSQGSRSCSVKLCFSSGCSSSSIIDALFTASAAVMLSNDIRRYVVFEACYGVPTAGGCAWYKAIIDGRRVKGFRMDEATLEGIADRILKDGRWPGVRVERISDGSSCCEGCTPLSELLGKNPKASSVNCILVDSLPGSGIKPWWLVAAYMILNERLCMQ